MAKRVAKVGVFVALAMVFSYIEVLIPFSVGIPGVKLGLANLVIVIGLYWMTPQETFLISMIRILLMGLLFGSGVSLTYSLAGGLLSFCMMLVLKKSKLFSMIGVSIIGGVSHNIGQIIAAAVVLESVKIATYLPVLIVAGIMTGAVIGIVAGRILRMLKQGELS